MILSGREISQHVRDGLITIDPFNEDQLNPNSYNYRLGSWLTVLPAFASNAQPNPSKLEAGGLTLLPGSVYLGHTAERIGSRHCVTSLIGRSSVGRLGLYLQISADLGNLGAAHSWTLEMCVVQPVRIYPGMIIGQVSFWKTLGEVEAYEGTYTRFSTPAACTDPELRTMRQ